MNSKTLYDVLGVSPTASPSEVSSAYMSRKEQVQLVCSQTSQDPESYRLSRELLEAVDFAYCVLGHPSERSNYDRWLLKSIAAKQHADQKTAKPHFDDFVESTEETLDPTSGGTDADAARWEEVAKAAGVRSNEERPKVEVYEDLSDDTDAPTPESVESDAPPAKPEKHGKARKKKPEPQKTGGLLHPASRKSLPARIEKRSLYLEDLEEPRSGWNPMVVCAVIALAAGIFFLGFYKAPGQEITLGKKWLAKLIAKGAEAESSASATTPQTPAAASLPVTGDFGPPAPLVATKVPVTFKAADDKHYVVSVVDLAKGTKITNAFVRSGDSLTVLCPNLSSQVKFAAGKGKDWQEKNLFGPSTEYFILDQKFLTPDPNSSEVIVELRCDGLGKIRWRRIEAKEFTN